MKPLFFAMVYHSLWHPRNVMIRRRVFPIDIDIVVVLYGIFSELHSVLEPTI